MANTIILKKSSVGGKVPEVGDLQYGELALNYTDGKLYYKNNLDVIRTLSGGTAVGGTLLVGLRDGSNESLTISGGEILIVARNGSNIVVPI